MAWCFEDNLDRLVHVHDFYGLVHGILGLSEVSAGAAVLA